MTSTRIRVDLWQRVYSGTVFDREDVLPEWPPSPYRLLSALLYGAHHLGSDDCSSAREALTLIAAGGNPIIWVPDACSTVLPGTFVPSSSISAQGTDLSSNKANLHLSAPAISRGGRAMRATLHAARTEMASPSLYFDIPVTLTSAQMRALRRAAARVGFFGRASHAADVTVTVADGAPEVGFTPLFPDTDQGRPKHGSEVRGWTEYALEELDQEFEAVFRAQIPAAPQEAKGVRVNYAPVLTVAEQFFVPVPLASSLPGSRVPSLMAGLRDVPHRNGRVRLLPLMQVGARHSTGRCSGIGVLAGTPEQSHLVARAIKSRPGFTTQRWRSGQALDGRRWLKTADRWYSATPAMFHPDQRIATWQVMDAIERRFGAAAEVNLSRTPVRPGQQRWTLTPHTGLRPWFVEIRLAQAITGPVVLGDSDDEGYGVMAPAGGE